MTCRHDRLRFRLWVGGILAREDWLPGATLDGDRWILGVAARDAPEATARGESWLVEVYDPDEIPDERYLRFGSDHAGMVLPVAVVAMIGSDDVT